MLHLTGGMKIKGIAAFAMTAACALGGLVAAGCGASTAVSSGAMDKTPSLPNANDSASTLRVLSAGDSLTVIFRYQKTFREHLKKEGRDVIFVGSQGKDDDKHEGRSGWQIGQLEDNLVQ